MHPADGKPYKKALEKSKENCDTICSRGEKCNYEACLNLHPGDKRFKKVLRRIRKRTGERCRYGKKLCL